MKRVVTITVTMLILCTLAYAQKQTIGSWYLLRVQSPVNAQHPLNRDMVGHWQVLPQVNEAGAVWKSTAVFAPLELTLNGMVPTSDTAGWNGTIRKGGFKEQRFDGTATYATVAPPLPLYDFADTTFTVSCWFKGTVTGYLVARRIQLGGPNGGWFIRVNSDGTIEGRIVDIINQAAAGRATVGTGYLDGNWHHVVIVFTTDTVTSGGNDMVIYGDGVLDQGSTGRTGNGYQTATALLAIGSTSDGFAGNFLTGSIDDVRVWQRGLSTAEAAWLYSETQTRQNGTLQWIDRGPTSVAQTSSGKRSNKGRTF